MKIHALLLISALQLSVIAAEKINPRHLHAKRQLPSPSVPSAPPLPATPPPPTSTSTSAPAPVAPPPGTPLPAATTTSPALPGVPPTSSGVSSDPSPGVTTPLNTIPALATYTGVPPLANITLGMATRPAPIVTAVFTPGATPPLSGAPVLPTARMLFSSPMKSRLDITFYFFSCAWKLAYPR
jgi:hypothetical protein